MKSFTQNKNELNYQELRLTLLNFSFYINKIKGSLNFLFKRFLYLFIKTLLIFLLKYRLIIFILNNRF